MTTVHRVAWVEGTTQKVRDYDQAEDAATKADQCARAGWKCVGPYAVEVEPMPGVAPDARGSLLTAEQGGMAAVGMGIGSRAVRAILSKREQA